MTAPHGIITVGRNYANGTKTSPTTNAQDRRIIQEIFRDLAQYVPGVDIAQLVEDLKEGLAEDGINNVGMTNLLKFYDGVRDRLVGGSGVVQQPICVGDRVRCPSRLALNTSHQPICVGDRVRCPSRLALNTSHQGDIWSGEVGTVIENQYGDDDIHVQWHGVSLYHHEGELERVSNAVPNSARDEAIRLMQANQKIQAIKVVREVTSMGLKEAKDYVEALPLPTTGATVSLADSGLVPSIINAAKRNDYGLSTAQDRELVVALLDSSVVRAALLNFEDEAYREAREAVADVLENSTIFDSDARVLVQAYENATDPRAAEKRAMREELERVEAQAAELRRKLAA